MTDGRDGQGTHGLSPRRVAFYMGHWEEICALAESPATAADLRDYLRREWIRLQELHPSIVCLCGPTDDQPQRPRGYRGGGSHGPPMSEYSDLRSQLVSLADLLPHRWQATRRIFRIQGREPELDTYLALDLWPDTLDTTGQRMRDALPEPRGEDRYGTPLADLAAYRMMARFTGWRPVVQPDEHALDNASQPA